MKEFYAGMALALLSQAAVPVVAEDRFVVDHEHPLVVDKRLSLNELIEQTLSFYPDSLLTGALTQESDALDQRADSWLAGPAVLSAFYLDDWLGDDIGSREVNAEMEVPLWRLGQSSAGQELARQAKEALTEQQAALRLKVTGLLRTVLWDLTLAEILLEQAENMLSFSERQLHKMEKRFQLGDISRSHLLLAKSDYLEKRSALTQAEAEVMHARKRFISLTGKNRVPSSFVETQHQETRITEQHPLLRHVSALISRKRAELEWMQSRSSGQPMLRIGMRSERARRGESAIESAGIGFSLPFGGGDTTRVDTAKINVELTQLEVARRQLWRRLERELHEAKHALEVDSSELAIAAELKDVAVKQLKMSELSYSAGEIDFLDLLKIQTQAHHAMRLAREREVQQKRDIALYNQAIGVQP